MEHRSAPVITRHPEAQDPPSRGPRPGPASTLAEVAAAVRTAGLAPHRTQDLIAALNTTARVLGRPLTDIPADPALLRRRLAEATPLAYGVNPRRWTNVRSLLAAALRLVGPLSPSRRSAAPLPPAWQALHGAVRVAMTDQRRFSVLSRFLRFCAERGITPAQVDQATFDAYRSWLTAGLRKNPEETYAALCRTWNRVANLVPDWPAFRVVRASRRQTWTLPWSAFPAALQADVQHSWLDRLAGTDLTEDAAFAPVRPKTVQTRAYQLRTAASALVLSGRAADTITSLADLASLDSFKAVLRHLRQHHGGTATRPVVHLAMLLKSIARHRLKVSQETLDAMGAIIRRLSRESGADRPGLTQTNRDRLQPFDDPAQRDALLHLPQRLMQVARTHKQPRQGARLAQTALAIELLLMAPLRIANLVALDTVRHLRRTRHSRHVSLVIEAHEVKNAEPLEYPLPAESVALLDTYLRDDRPLLAPPGSTALFPGLTSRRPKHTSALRQQITQTIRRYTGLTIHPHLFRHIAAKLYLDQNPGAYEVVRRVFGHRSSKTTIRFYTGLETTAAVRHFDEVILQLRKPGSKA